ncbi:MAG: hydroxymethylbilane synthase [Pseudobdellovibrio sp.]
MSNSPKTLKISARSSHLAKLQAFMVGDALKEKYPDLQIKFEFRESLGDKNLTDPLWKMPEKGVFTEDFYQDLVLNKTDMIVHSWKDLPVEGKPDTLIAATLPRADQRDILIFKKDRLHKTHINLFTSSPRREHNLKNFLTLALPYKKEKVSFSNVRGNVPTRLRKLMATNDVDGMIMAKAAVDRFLTAKWPEIVEVQPEIKKIFQENFWMALPLSINPNAAAQGALAVEIKSEREDLKELLTSIHCQKTYDSAQFERKTLKSYGGGCHQKIGVAHLQREYGEIFFLQGLTDQGVVLNAKELKTPFRPKVNNLKKWSSTSLNSYVTTRNLKFEIENKQQAFFVSKATAWKEDLQKVVLESYETPEKKCYVWTAGLETWKKLAAQGIWVNGSSEGLGVAEDKRIDWLLDSLEWTQVTHKEAYRSAKSEESFQKQIHTYELEINTECLEKIKNEILSADVLFWTSGVHFDFVNRFFPEIQNKQHACGVGHTAHFLKEKYNIYPYLYLNEQEFLNE